MKLKNPIYVRCASDVAELDEPNLQNQVSSVFAHINRQVMSDKIKAGIARKNERTTYQVVKGRTKRYQYNVTKMRRPSVIKNRN